MPARETLPDGERLQLANDLKARGTAAFKQCNWPEALRLYDEAAHYLSDAYFGAEAAKAASSLEHPEGAARVGVKAPYDLSEEEAASAFPRKPPERFEGQQEEAKALLLSCLLNASQCALKQEGWRDAEARTSRALQLDKSNVKALFRRGTARTKLGDYGDARADLRKACELDPKSKEVREMFDACKVAEKEEREASKAFYSNTKVAEGGYEAPVEEEEKMMVY